MKSWFSSSRHISGQISIDHLALPPTKADSDGALRQKETCSCGKEALSCQHEDTVRLYGASSRLDCEYCALSRITFIWEANFYSRQGICFLNVISSELLRKFSHTEVSIQYILISTTSHIRGIGSLFISDADLLMVNETYNLFWKELILVHAEKFLYRL